VIKRIFIGIAWAAGGLAAVVLLSVGILIWRLSSGPVSLGAFTPVVELALNTVSGPLHVAVDDTVLNWQRSEEILVVRLVNVTGETSNAEVAIDVSEASVELKTNALSRGVIAPTQIEIVRPGFRVVRAADGTDFSLFGDPDENTGSGLSSLMSALGEMADPSSGMYDLKSIRVIDGSLDIDDRKMGHAWRGTLKDTMLWREPSGINIKGSLTAATDGETTELAILGEYIAEDEKLSAGLTFTQFRPAVLASIDPILDNFAALDLPVRGTLSTLVDGDGTIENSGFDLLGGVGHLALPVKLAQELNMLAAAQRVAVRGFELNGSYEGKEMAVDIAQFNIDLEADQTVYLPQPLDHNMPLSSIHARGKYMGGDDRAELTSLELDLAGPQVVVSGTADGLGSPAGLTAKAKVTAKNIRTDDIARYWPSSVATDAQEWCTEHLSDGSITEARLDVAASGNLDDIEITSLAGSMDIKGVSVDYLPPMPKARNASGVGVFDMTGLTITINSGEAAGVSVRRGTAKLYDFDTAQEKADIDLSLAGPLPKVLALIDKPPLGYAKEMGLDPTETRGTASGNVRLRFPLLADLPLDALRVSAKAKLENVFVAKIALGADVTNGTLTIDLTEKGMDVTGPVVVGQTQANIVWRENFETGSPFDTRLAVAIANADFQLLQDLKIQDAPVLENYLKGPLGVNVLYVSYPSGSESVEIKVDARKADIVFPYFGWKKVQGVPATGSFKATLQEGRLTEVSSFELKSQEFDVAGSVLYADSGDLSDVKLSRVAIGRTNMNGIVKAHSNGGWDISLDGQSLDIGPLIEELEEPGTDDQPQTLEQLPLSITANLGMVWVASDHPLKKVSAKIVRDRDLWNPVRIDARVGKDTPLSISIASEGSQQRNLRVRSSDAGSTLRSLGVYEHMIGGELKISGTYNDAVAGNPLNGKVRVNDYRIKKAPGLAKILSIMALTGILDQFRGDGIGFKVLDVPFALQNGVVHMKNGRASGTELGMTAEGRVGNGTANVEGTIVPFYAVNSLLGKIPLVGPLFSGGDKGGGLLAARYSIVGSMDDPDVTVNPLSMLAPGFLRNLFDVFEPGTGVGSGAASPSQSGPQYPDGG